MAETRTARAALPHYSAGGDSFSRADWNEAATQIDSLMAIDAFGTRAARPAAGTRGRYYHATDTKVIFRDTGTAWEVVGATTEGPMLQTAAVAADVILTLKGAAAQSGNILEYKDSGNVVLFKVEPDGDVVSLGTISARLLRALGTAVADVPLRAGGVSGQTGNLMELQVNGSNVLSVNSGGDIAPRAVAPVGLSGATSASRFVGGTNSGAPTSGTFAIGDMAVARNGSIWICTAAGSPGTWVEITASTVSAPPGAITQYAGSAAPSGWLLCDGAAVSRTTYAALYAAVGTTFGAGDGSTTFNVPNLKGRFPVGIDAAQTEFDVRGETGGVKTVTLAEANMPAHTHALDHDHPSVVSAAGSAHNHPISVTVNSMTGSSGNTGVNHTHNANHGHSAGSYGAGNHSHQTYLADVPKSGSGTFAKGYSGTPGDATTGVGDHAHGVYVDANNFNVSYSDPAHTHTIDHGHSASGSSTNESAHTHSVDVAALVGASGSTGSGSAVATLPPYIALHYIIKT